MLTITIGVDLAKHVFSVCTVDFSGRVLQRKELRRDAFALWLSQLPAGAIVAMEACSGAHHWGRRCLEHGLVPRLMAAQFVKPFRKSPTAKNDRNDAEAIATSARQGNMRFVPVKTVDQRCRRVRAGLTPNNQNKSLTPDVDVNADTDTESSPLDCVIRRLWPVAYLVHKGCFD